MSADLSIHILDKGATEQDYKDLSRNTLGSKYFGGFGCIPLPEGRQDEVYDHFSKSSQIWVGEVSWLKAGLTGDKKTYVPDIVHEIHGIIGEDFPVINEDLIEKVEAAYDKCVNKTSYEVEKKKKITDFLKEHKGEKACTISW
ncbi:hypothetical protein ES703_103466 [subsurface metagenome]